MEWVMNAMKEIQIRRELLREERRTWQHKIPTIVPDKDFNFQERRLRAFWHPACSSSELIRSNDFYVEFAWLGSTRHSRIYVGQAYHEGHLLPAKVTWEEQSYYACISYDGEVFRKDSFNVLCFTDSRLRLGSSQWVKARDGSIPWNAIPGGRTASGVELYIGRGKFNGIWLSGKVFPNDRRLHSFYDNCEVLIKNFEILVTY